MNLLNKNTKGVKKVKNKSFEKANFVENCTKNFSRVGLSTPSLFWCIIKTFICAAKKFAYNFADDTCINIEGKNVNTKELNVVLLEIFKWLNCNELTLNIQKTHFLNFFNWAENLNLNFVKKLNNRNRKGI